MMITYSLSEEDIKLAIKDYCAKWLRDDQVVIDLDKIWLKRSDADPKTQIFSATVNPTKITLKK